MHEERSIHPTAIVSRSARLGEGVVIGPLCIIGDDVVLGAGTRLLGSCTVLGPTRFGERNTIHPYAVLGADPQDRSYEGERTELEIGDDNVFREHVTVHRGTVRGRGLTRVGSHCLFMAGAHLAHDVTIADRVTLANGTLLAGHVCIDADVTSGGRASVAQYVHIGKGSFLAAGAMVERDVPPWVIAAGDRARVRALNRVALERCGVPASSREALKRAFRALFASGEPRALARARMAPDLGRDPYVADLLAFLDASREPRDRARTR